MAVIQVENLQKCYRTRVAVEDVSFTVSSGELFGIIGPNGAGKTTTVECVAGLRAADRGRVDVLGFDPRRDRAELRQCLGVQLQESELPDKLTVGEVLDLYRSFYRNGFAVVDLLDMLGLGPQRKTRYRKLSGGQKQRLSVALALIGRPKIAILDELTTGLDPQARRDTWQLIHRIREDGVTIVLVTHFMAEAERLCDRVALIDAGRVVATGTPSGLADRIGTEQRIRFRADPAVHDRLFQGIACVKRVARSGGELTVTGSGGVLGEVLAALARAGITPEGLRVERANLEDAFVAMTGDQLRQPVSDNR